MKKLLIAGLVAAAASGVQAQLYSNGPVVDSAGLSILQAPSTTLGLASNATFAVAENFTVTGPGWNVSSLDFFGYQTGATSFSFTGVTWSLIAGTNANATGSTVASGTTAVTNGGLVGYRVTTTTLTATNRPIYRISANIPDITLAPGSYYLTWSLAGSLASGPFVPATLGSVGIGNALSGPAAGGGFATPFTSPAAPALPEAILIELPFVIQGSVVPEPSTYALMLAGAAGVLVFARRRRQVD